MSLSATIARHIPMLRRFARALTGSQASGDAYALATIEAIASGDIDMAGGAPADARRALFSVFVRLWASVPLNASAIGESSPETMAAADRVLEEMDPLARVTFLLRGLEDFSVGEIAAMLRRSPEDVDMLLGQAGREIAARISTGILIIEDEPIIAMDLEALVLDLGHTVTHIARTHAEAIAAIREDRPGLVLADINLADGSSGLDAVNEILQTYRVPVVFITAYPERLLTGERPEPAFLITKPFQAGTVKAIVSQALFFERKAAPRGTPMAAD
jgi:CheY-like chemotaxis protein/DNA-directed RNA polymerase specialized sigma24 family protein